MYQKEIEKHKAPPLPAAWQVAGKKTSARKHYSWLQAALVLVMLCIFMAALFNATGNQQNGLAKLFTEVSRRFEIERQLPEGIEKLHQIICTAFKNCS